MVKYRCLHSHTKHSPPAERAGKRPDGYDGDGGGGELSLPEHSGVRLQCSDWPTIKLSTICIQLVTKHNTDFFCLFLIQSGAHYAAMLLILVLVLIVVIF